MNMIQEQHAYNNAQIYNAEQINNNLFDNPLKFFCDKKVIEHPELDNYFQVVRYIVNIDVLKQRFGGSNYKYEELVNQFENIDSNLIKSSELDDGYKSIIKCIVKISSYFKLKVENNIERLEIKDTDSLTAIIEDMGLKIRYNNIKSYDDYICAKNISEDIKNELAPYLNCAAQYGNFLQFNNIFIEELKDAPFIPHEVRFKVSNNIIPNLIKPLYGESPECGLREIIQNACDASKELVEQNKQIKLEELKVKVFLKRDDTNCELIVRDYGIGMNEEVLISKYFIVGESSKKESRLDLVGQFGIGALAAFLLGDEIKVKTRYWNDDITYEFKYFLSTDENKNENINIIKKEDKDFHYGTEITIKLNKSLAEEKDDKLKEVLKLDEWYVLSDVAIEYYVQNEEQKIFVLSGKGYQWNKLVDKDTLKVNYLEEDSDNEGKIIYNGLVIPETYKFNLQYLKKKPYLAINSTDGSIKLNLERSKIETGIEEIIKELEHKLVKLSMQELINNKNNIVDSTGKILKSTYSNKYIRELPLFFCKEGFGVYSSKNMEHLRHGNKYKNIIKIYGYTYTNVNLSELDDDSIYLFESYTLNRTSIAELIESFGTLYVPVRIIEEYFYNATSQYNGFRKDSMKKLYEYYGTPFPNVKSANAMWNYHNENKENIFREKINKEKATRKYILLGNKKEVKGLEKFYKHSIVRIYDLQYCYPDINGIDTNIVKI